HELEQRPEPGLFGAYAEVQKSGRQAIDLFAYAIGESPRPMGNCGCTSTSRVLLTLTVCGAPFMPADATRQEDEAFSIPQTPPVLCIRVALTSTCVSG